MSASTIAPTPATEPIPVVGARGWKDVAATLRVRNFRLAVLSMASGAIGGWMSRVAQDWLILELTDNVALVGLAITFQSVPIMLLGLWGGLLSDRFGRRGIVLIAQTVSVLILVTLTVLALTGHIQVWQIYLCAVASGLVGVAESPARTALVTQIVPPHNLQTAIGINAMTFHVAGLIGPTVCGIMIASVGTGWSLGAASALAILSLTTISLIRTRELRAAQRAPRGSGIGDGLRYAARKPTIRWPLVILAAVAAFGMTHTVLYAAAARDVGYDTGAQGYGLYMALGAIGAIIGAILSMRRKTIGLRVVVLCAAAFGVSMLVAAAAPAEFVFCGAVVVLSMFRILFGTGAESIVQLSSRASIRGRVASVYLIVLVSGQAGGAVFVGWVAQTFGAPTAFAVAGGVPLLTAITVGLILMRTRQLRFSVTTRAPFVSIVPPTGRI